ncbi:DUF3368 domain-containing protein [Nostoc sp.]|uniref:DUF3368 domain-containing protein n=1 Tax=Nostoc sp. TaxID=1180 RepID=UPI002FF5EFF8
MSLALKNSDFAAIVDDRAAQRCGQALGITTIGTGGLLILAKRRGLIPSISPGIQALRDAGLWLSDTLVNLLKTSSRGIAIAINCNFKWRSLLLHSSSVSCAPLRFDSHAINNIHICH